MEEGIQYSLSKLTKVKDHYDILYTCTDKYCKLEKLKITLLNSHCGPYLTLMMDYFVDVTLTKDWLPY